MNQLKLVKATLIGGALAIAVAAACTGCATKTRSVEIDGMFTQAEAGTLAIGSVEVMAAPVGEETATIKYAEDTAWLSPYTKTHEIKILLTGTNAVNCATSIVDSICGAFVKTAPSLAQTNCVCVYTNTVCVSTDAASVQTNE